ncbi:predicted protein [Coccidioides posadasii str. Silveira]|uniref:Predicted protein n=2 Tax=Coccidioides posadasii TaxID=199306 RepID=E9CV91_COCPS|nr:predicted protein [Coccidioides posadasii str. Silveira]KMM71636.1 hypothetical protein CPAG_07940 [Coccidioides posadasii RMSCC 3488]
MVAQWEREEDVRTDSRFQTGLKRTKDAGRRRSWGRLLRGGEWKEVSRAITRNARRLDPRCRDRDEGRRSRTKLRNRKSHNGEKLEVIARDRKKIANTNNGRSWEKNLS